MTKRSRKPIALPPAPGATPRREYRPTGPTLKEWAKSVGGKFGGKIIASEIRQSGEARRVWVLMRTSTDWEKWIEVPADVNFTLREIWQIKNLVMIASEAEEQETL